MNPSTYLAVDGPWSSCPGAPNKCQSVEPDHDRDGWTDGCGRECDVSRPRFSESGSMCCSAPWLDDGGNSITKAEQFGVGFGTVGIDWASGDPDDTAGSTPRAIYNFDLP